MFNRAKSLENFLEFLESIKKTPREIDDKQELSLELESGEKLVLKLEEVRKVQKLMLVSGDD